ncbi:uncharacterized protein LOC102720456 [Oryza brachyantha]|uniref:Uncharacterized protein n=1 Tax=Oryza brachyantha TaxID=4533 RepID=J3MYB9_ORYBR|nr:uncharacterized protein LOC102720456 [Oryza brachyantha]
MATLTLPPAAAAAAAQAGQEDPSVMKNPTGDAADSSGIDSGWVVLGKSDIVSADLAAAAADTGHRQLGFSPLPMLPIWVQMMLGGVVYTAVPFYKRVRKIEGVAIENAETALEVVEHAAEVTEKLADNVANALPENGKLHELAEEIEYIAEIVDKDAQKVEVIIKKIEDVSNQIDAAVEPVIEDLEKEFKP